MCGKLSKRYLLLLAVLLLLPSLCGALDYDGPALLEGWYPISESQLTALETEFKTQRKLTAELRTLLQQAESQLLTAQESLMNSTQALDAAGLFLERLETNIDVLIAQRNFALIATIGLAVVAVVGFLW